MGRPMANTHYSLFTPSEMTCEGNVIVRTIGHGG
jgi:hypothetical protein